MKYEREEKMRKKDRKKERKEGKRKKGGNVLKESNENEVTVTLTR